MLGGLSGGGVAGYGAAQVQQVHQQRQDPPRSVPRRARMPLASEGCTCSPPCGKSQTCYRCTCADVASGLKLEIGELREAVERLAGGEEPLSAGAVR